MITSTSAFLRYFDGVHRRTVRDVDALPPEAAAWTPAAGDSESAWGIAELIAHIARSRGFFLSAYRAEGWIMPLATESDSADWTALLNQSAAALSSDLEATPDEWLLRRVPLIEGDGSIAGWRVLMMLVEHEVHHRSQIDTYAGLNGWSPPDIFGLSAEGIAEREPSQREGRGAVEP